MVTKEAAMSFSQFGYPYNATSQVRPFLKIVFNVMLEAIETIEYILFTLRMCF